MGPRLAIAASVAIIGFPTSLGAQTDASGPVRQAIIESLHDSQWVRLSAAEVGRWQGRLHSHGPFGLVLSRNPEPLRIPVIKVDTLWTRGASTLQGAIVGSILGLGLGIVAASSGFGEEDEDRTTIWLMCLGAGTAGGGLIGALVGTAVPRWKRRYP